MEDLIRRDDAMQVAFLYPFFSDALMEEIKAIPSAYRPQGEWLDTGKDPDHSHPLTAIWYKCSECGDGTNTKTNFCPNCGAKMKQ